METLDANATLRYALGGHERAGLDALFAAVDADGDGGVSLTELGTFLAFADDELELTETTAAAVRALHRASDADTDGALLPAEFDARALARRADEASVERDLDAAASRNPARATDEVARSPTRGPSRAPWKDGPPPATATATSTREDRENPAEGDGRAAAVGGGEINRVVRAVRHRPSNTCGPCEGVLRGPTPSFARWVDRWKRRDETPRPSVDSFEDAARRARAEVRRVGRGLAKALVLISAGEADDERGRAVPYDLEGCAGGAR